MIHKNIHLKPHLVILTLFFLFSRLFGAEEPAGGPSVDFVNPLVFSAPLSAKSKDINDSLASMALDPTGEVFVLTSRTSELIHLDSEGNTKTSVFPIKVNPSSPLGYKKTAIDSKNNFYFLGLDKITKYDNSLKLISNWPDKTTDRLSFCMNIKFDPSGFLWVLQSNCKITMFNEHLSPLKTLELKPKLNLTFPTVFHSWDFAFDSKGDVYIITAEDFIFKFNSGGECLGAFGGRGGESGHLLFPRAIACGPDDNIYVADANGRIERFDTNGDFIAQWKVGDRLLMEGLAVDKNNDVWVLAGGNILKFNGDLLKKDINYFVNEGRKDDQNVRPSRPFTLDEKGEIGKDFWKYSPPSPGFGEDEFRMIKASQSLVAFAKSIGEANLPIAKIAQYDPTTDDSADDDTVEDTNYTKKDFIKFKQDFKTLGDLGFDFSEDNVGGNEDLERYQETSWGYLWGFYNCLYFIPTNHSNKAFLIDGSMNHVDRMEMESLGNDKYRIIVWRHGDTGGAFIHIYDLDLINQKLFSFECDAAETGDQVLDLRKNGHYDIIIVQEVAESIKWPWIFSYIGGEWMDTSSDFPDFYKTKGVDIVLDKGINWTDQKDEQEKVMSALKNAALKGGPSAFGQFTHIHQMAQPGAIHYKHHHMKLSPVTTPVN